MGSTSETARRCRRATEAASDLSRSGFSNHVVALLGPQAATSRLHRTVRSDPGGQAPVGPDLIHEIKHDGYRLIVRKKDDRVRLFTRRGYDWTDRFPLIVGAVAALQSSALVLDGEAVCCDADGVASFEKLHSQAHNDKVFLYAFDVLELGGVDLRVEPLEKRRGRLQRLLSEVSQAPGSSSTSTSTATGRPSSSTPASWVSRASSRSTGSAPINRGRASHGSR
jgi:ATP-dependent DNA ligase